MRFGDLDAAIRLIAGDNDARRQSKKPTATLTASSFDLNQFGKAQVDLR
jgi:hypothetical protein